MKEKKEYDFFISHASEDKEIFVRQLASQLMALGYKVWFDENTLNIGDSLFSKISEGIKNSNYGIVILSKNFLRKEWTKKELSGLISKEIFTSTDVILPVWLEITAEEVFSYSPLLADKVSVLVTREEVDKVIDKVLKLSQSQVTTYEMLVEKVKFIRESDTYERKKYALDAETRIKNLVYFQEAYYDWFCDDNVFGGEEWDDFLAEKKQRELQNRYSLPYNVEYNSEFHPGPIMNYIVKQTKKWIIQKTSIYEIAELIFLLNWYHELDLPYILFGYPEESLNDEQAYDFCFLAPYMTSSKRIYSQEEIERARLEVHKEYFSAD